jgi:hypothetical protein
MDVTVSRLENKNLAGAGHGGVSLVQNPSNHIRQGLYGGTGPNDCLTTFILPTQNTLAELGGETIPVLDLKTEDPLQSFLVYLTGKEFHLDFTRNSCDFATFLEV